MVFQGYRGDTPEQAKAKREREPETRLERLEIEYSELHDALRKKQKAARMSTENSDPTEGRHVEKGNNSHFLGDKDRHGGKIGELITDYYCYRTNRDGNRGETFYYGRESKSNKKEYINQEDFDELVELLDRMSRKQTEISEEKRKIRA